MKLIIAEPSMRLSLSTCRYYNAAGLQFESLTLLRKYIRRIDDLLYIVIEYKTVDKPGLKKLVDHWIKNNNHRTLRYGSNGMLKDVKRFYQTCKDDKKMIILHESLMIFYLIKKYGKCTN
jgi:hypothetical protein